MQTSDRTRGVALLVPRLLSIQTDPAELETADAVADAVERSAEALLRWHDELAEIHTSPAPVTPDPDPVLLDQSANRGAHASARLAQRVRGGVVPGDPASLEAAAAELLSIAHAVRRAAAPCPDAAIRGRGDRIATALTGLATALRSLADTMRTEARRLAGGGAGGPDQVLGRVVRAEHAARIAAATTLPS